MVFKSTLFVGLAETVAFARKFEGIQQVSDGFILPTKSDGENIIGCNGASAKMRVLPI
jgi:hypothetical protein